MSIEAMNRVWMFAPHDGKSLTVLLALADHANAASICWPSAASLMLFSRTRHERNLRQYLRELEATGDLYYRRGNGRTHRSRYLVATGLTEIEIFEVLIDREHFDMERNVADSAAKELVVRQAEAQAKFEKSIPLSDLRARRRFGLGPRPTVKRGITQPPNLGEKGDPFRGEGGSADADKEDQANQPKEDQVIRQKRRSTPSSNPKPTSEPPTHEPPNANRQETPPLTKNTGGDGLTDTSLFLVDDLDMNVSVAREFGDLPLEPVKELVARKRRAGAKTGAIVQVLRVLRGQLLRVEQASVGDGRSAVAGQEELMQRAHAIAPDADELGRQYLLLDLEDGYNDEEVRDRHRQRTLVHREEDQHER